MVKQIPNATAVQAFHILPTRRQFFACADHIMQDMDNSAGDAPSPPAQGHGIAYLRLSHLGTFNLRTGSEAGDALLARMERHMAKRLTNPDEAAGIDTGHTFLALGPIPKLIDIHDELTRMLPEDDESGGLMLKMGLCELRTGWNAHDLVDRCRFALNAVRFRHDTDVSYFDDQLSSAYDRHEYVTNHLDDAIANGEICIYTQPIVRIVTGRVCELEVLARWQSSEFGLISPGEFVPELERMRTVHKLDAEVVRQACMQWREAENLGISVPFGINLSRLDFELCDIYSIVRDAMRRYDVPVDAIHVEITESATTGSENRLKEGIQRFREAGFTLYMDDFGTGYSSLDGLIHNDYDVMKIDMSLLREVESNERARAVVTSAVDIAKRVGMQTLCEGVENLEQLRFLQLIGCEKGQGYFFGRPVGHSQTLKRLRQHAERYEEPGFKAYQDLVGQVNLIDGTRANVQGVESAAFLGSTPVAVIEMVGHRIEALAQNAAFKGFLHSMGMSSYTELIARMSAGTGEIRKRFELAAIRARQTGERQTVDYMAGGFFSVVGIDFVAATQEREAYLITATSVASSDTLARGRSLELAAPFLVSIYKRIDLFDLVDGTSLNLYLSSPLLASVRTGGSIYAEVREFADRNVHPDDRERFLDFYDLSTLEERVRAHQSNNDTTLVRTRVLDGSFEDHVYTLIPMSVGGRQQVLSSCRARQIVDEAGLRQTATSDSRTQGTELDDTALLDALLDGVDRNVFWKDSERRFLGANQAFLDYYGFQSLDQILGKTDENLGWHVDDDPFRNDELRVLQGAVTQHVQGTCFARNELRVIEASKRPIKVGDKIVGLMGYFHDLGPARRQNV